jgi:dihydroorotate dehydrogenase (fumarate)
LRNILKSIISVNREIIKSHCDLQACCIRISKLKYAVVTGYFTGEDVIKLILSGASSVQVVSTLYKNGISHISKMKSDLEDWMEEKNYNSLEDFRGKLSKNKLTKNPFVYKRAQYVDLIMNAEDIFGNN